MHLVDYTGRGGHQIQIVLPFQTFLDDLQVQKAQEAAAESKAQRNRGLRLKLQSRVIELQLFQCIPKIRIFCPVRRIHTAVHHGVHFFISRKRLLTGTLRIRHGISHPGILYIFQAGGDISHHTGAQFLARDKLPCAEIPDLHHFRLCPGSHHQDLRPFADLSFLDPAEHDHAPIGIIHGIKDQRLQRCLRIAFGRRDLPDDLFQDVIHIQPGLCGDQGRLLGVNTDHVLDLLLDPLRLRAGQIDLIDHGHDIQVMIQRQVDICQGLGLHSLGRVHHQDRPVAGCQAPGNLVVKIHMPRRIDQIENVFFSVSCLVDRAHRLGLDGDAPLPLQIHVVQHLGLHLPAGQKPGLLDDPVRQCGFPMVYMGNNTKIPYFTLFYLCHVSSSSITTNSICFRTGSAVNGLSCAEQLR